MSARLAGSTCSVILAPGASDTDGSHRAGRADRGVDEFARNQVSVGVREDLPPSGVELCIERRDGSAAVVHRDAPGEPAEPLTRAQICENLDTAGRGPIVDTVFDAGSRPATEVIAALRAASSPETERSGREYASRH
jgi:hypothetical protein